MNSFFRVFSFEFMTQFKKKSFVLTTVIMALIVFVITIVPLFLGSDDESQTPEISQTLFSEAGVVFDGLSESEVSLLENVMSLSNDQVYLSRSELETDLKNYELEVGFVISSLTEVETIYMNRGMDVNYEVIITSVMRDIYRNVQYADLGIDGREIAQIESTQINNELTILGKDSVSNYIINYISSFAVYMVLVLYGSMTATSVAREKDDRTMELLITSTKPKYLIFGKVIAVSAITIFQVAMVVLAGIIGFTLAKHTYPDGILSFLETSLSLDVVLVLLFFYLIGYVLYMFVFAAVGSMVSRVEDVQNVTMPVLMLIIVGLFISMFSFTGAIDPLIKVASMFPLTSFVVMPNRYIMTVVSLPELLISGGLLILSVVFFAYLSIKIYRWGSLYYGNKMSLFKVIRQVFSKE